MKKTCCGSWRGLTKAFENLAIKGIADIFNGIMAEQTMVCIGCPLGCDVTLKIDKKGGIKALTGNQCKEGKEYMIAEFRSPVRVFTATVLMETGKRLLPVRTDKPVHKGQLKDLMRAVAGLRLVPPVKTGQVLIPNILGTGADLVASSSI